MRKNKIDKKEKRDLPLALMHKLELDKAPTENYKSWINKINKYI